MHRTSVSLTQRIKSKAKSLGFAACRITSGRPLCMDGLVGWLKENKHGTMKWMERDPAARCDPASLLPGAKSVICCAQSYGKAGIINTESARRCGYANVRSQSQPIQCTKETGYRLDPKARFARGADYHKVVSEKLELLAGRLREIEPKAKTRCCVDTSPIMEKALAVRAGIGWQGKNMLLVNPLFGSWFVLGEIITDVVLEFDGPIENRCGDCRACLEACPTGALDGMTLDAKRCISYLTIEHRGDVDSELMRFIDDEKYGCDICQNACPFN